MQIDPHAAGERRWYSGYIRQTNRKPMLNPIRNFNFAGKRTVPFTLALLLTLACARADDTEIYQGNVQQSNVLFVLDASGSMGSTDGTGQTRMQRMKDAMKSLLRNIKGIDVGIMQYTSNGGGGGQLLHPVADVETNLQSLESSVDSIVASGGTPTVAALLEAKHYLSGDPLYRGWLPSGITPYPSPVSSECETNHIVLLTDGQPTSDNDAVTAVQNLPGFNNTCTARAGGRGTCGVELARHLFTTNQFPQLSGNDNNIVTHTIGFNIVDNWLQQIATAGGGTYEPASSANDLLIAFQSILDIVQLTSTIAAPTVSVNAFNQSRHRDELYYSFFQPGMRPRWEGNVKKYRLLDGEIVGADNQPLIVDGEVSPASRSLWAQVENNTFIPDGAEVNHGGMAARQPANRRWYTDYRQRPDPDNRTTPLLVTSTTPFARSNLSRLPLRAANNTERDTLVNWVRGADSIDRDSDGDTTEPNHYVADGLHTTPYLMSYRAMETSDLQQEVLFSTNNMGVLHAVDADTGNELWSYTPAELLPNIKKYVDNTDTSHVYGLDGEMTAHVTFKDDTTYDYEIDKAWLYLTQRRGGNNIFALDVSNALSTTDPFKVLWKINGGRPFTDFRNLAQTWSVPQVIPVKYNCPGNCATRDVLVFSGGYNPAYDNKDLSYSDSAPRTGHGNAIYMVDPQTGELLWSAGKGAHHDLNLPINHSIPATPVPVDTDGDGNIDILFFSDIAGHVWRVDLAKDPANSSQLAKSGGMIAALNESGQALRFFNRPDVVINGTTSGTATFNIILGSGMRSSPLHIEPDNNRLFSIQDTRVFESPIGDTPDPTTGEFQPDYRYVKDTAGNRSVITPADLQDLDTNSLATTSRYGYFKTFESGEKILQSTLTHSSRVFVTSYMPPGPAAAGDPCSHQIGTSRLYILDVLSGTNRLPPDLGDPYMLVGAGIVSTGTIVDTGSPGGADFVTGLNKTKLIDLLEPPNPDTFRKIRRTGWVELDY